MRVSVKVQGLRTIRRGFDRLSDRREYRRIMRQGTKLGAKELQRGVTPIAPRRTGKTKRAIKARAMKRSRKSVGAVVLHSSRTLKAGGSFYSRFSDVGSGNQEAQEYSLKGFRARAKRALTTANRFIRDELERLGAIKRAESFGITGRGFQT